MGVQNSRLFERCGLLPPTRARGGSRRYSHDLGRLRRISDLLDAGRNPTGIALVQNTEADHAGLRSELTSPPKLIALRR